MKHDNHIITTITSTHAPLLVWASHRRRVIQFTSTAGLRLGDVSKLALLALQRLF
jgi:hypothetical protein